VHWTWPTTVSLRESQVWWVFCDVLNFNFKWFLKLLKLAATIITTGFNIITISVIPINIFYGVFVWFINAQAHKDSLVISFWLFVFWHKYGHLFSRCWRTETQPGYLLLENILVTWIWGPSYHHMETIETVTRLPNNNWRCN